MREKSLLADLNPEQREAAYKKDGAWLVTAGPGTGKTRTMTARVEALVEGGIDPGKILVMTFTKKAANEIRERLAAVSPVLGEVRAGTFHSVAIGIIREEYGDHRFTLFDDGEELSALKGMLAATCGQRKDEDVDGDSLFAFYRAVVENGDRIRPGDVPRVYHAILGEDADVPEGSVGGRGDEVTERFYAQFAPIFANGKYCNLDTEDAVLAFFDDFSAYKAENAIFSYNDCIIEARRILDSPAGRKYRERYLYVNVDEFQDSDIRQIAMVNSLVRDHGNIFVVGDSKQSIYAWRGAHFRVFDDFRERWSPGEVELVRNYRSTEEIIDAVNAVALIRRDPSAPLCGTERNGSGVLIDLPYEYIPEEAASKIAKRIGEALARGVAPSDIAVLFRSHRYGTSGALQGHLQRKGIPFDVIGGIRMTDRVLFKNIRNVMRIVDNPRCRMPWQSLASQFPGIGKVQARAIADEAAKGENFRDAVRRVGTIHGTSSAMKGLDLFRRFLGRIAGMDAGTPSRNILAAIAGPLALAAAGLDQGRAMTAPDRLLLAERHLSGDRGLRQEAIDYVKECADRLRNYRPETDMLGRPVQETPQERNRRKRDYDALSTLAGMLPMKLADASAILRFADMFCSGSGGAGDWLDKLAFDEGTKDENRERITLSTIHGAKGREWNEVHVPELVRDCFPSSALMRKIETDARRLGIDMAEAARDNVSWNEEKNLLYVAVSRAKMALVLYADMRSPSPILAELAAVNREKKAIRTTKGDVWNSGGACMAPGGIR